MPNSITVAVSGADGFIGRNLCQRLRADGVAIRPLYGPRSRSFCEFGEPSIKIDLSRDLPSQQQLAGCDVFIHLAGVAHRFDPTAADSIERINGSVPALLAMRAHQSGVRRFVFISSAAVIPLATSGNIAEVIPPAHQDRYGSAKLLAEIQLQEIAHSSGIELVIVRPPAVYGPGCPGRLAQLMRLIRLGVPFPHAHNKRSLVGIANLVDLLVLCSNHPDAAGGTFGVSDCELSSEEIICFLAQGMGKTPVFLPLPESTVRFGLRLIRQTRQASHSLDSFVIDSEPVRRLLGWSPAKSAPQGLSETGAHFIQGLMKGIAVPALR
jgi:nucleoside-diphosphate-sugar epimerase